MVYIPQMPEVDSEVCYSIVATDNPRMDNLIRNTDLKELSYDSINHNCKVVVSTEEITSTRNIRGSVLLKDIRFSKEDRESRLDLITIVYDPLSGHDFKIKMGDLYRWYMCNCKDVLNTSEEMQ